MQSFITIKVRRRVVLGLEQFDVMVNGTVLHWFPSETAAKLKMRQIVSKLYREV